MTEALPRRANGWERGSELIAGVLVLTLVAPVGILIGLLHQAFGGQPERAVGIIAAVLGLLVLMPPVAYLVARRRNMVPSTCAFIALTTVGVVLSAAVTPRGCVSGVAGSAAVDGLVAAGAFLDSDECAHQPLCPQSP